MTDLLSNYLPIVIFIGIAGVIGLALLVAPFIIAVKHPDPEKVSAYECGFEAFDDARMKFDVRFYLVSILFIIFDLEVAFLFPWAVAFKDVGLVRLLVDDDLPRRADRRLHLRVAKGCAGMGLTPASGTLIAPRPVGAIDPSHQPADRRGRSVFPRDQQRARRQGLSRHLYRRADQLGPHRLADVDDVRSRLLRRRDDPDVDAAL